MRPSLFLVRLPVHLTHNLATIRDLKQVITSQVTTLFVLIYGRSSGGLGTFPMTERRSRPPSILLEPPPKGVELDDPGAQPSPCESEEEHFSDASEGIAPSLRSRTPSPIPRTRVEKIDNSPSYGEVPGSPAYETRRLDAVPDEIEILGNGPPSRPGSRASTRATLDPKMVPRTIVEKIDPSSPSYGEEPGTRAYESHKADSAPDMIFKIQEQSSQPCITSPDQPQNSSTEGSPVPETMLCRVESPGEHDLRRSFTAHRRGPSDSLPDVIQTVPDVPDPSIEAMSDGKAP
ncbi:hypothetical protein, variant [Blastomyces dermatitidis ATCC 26199]|nr:hypothetical protein, variant [Blastomyces dermatitidis ATCC 26199]